MNKKALKTVYAFLGTLIACGFLVGIGFILNTFWEMNKGTTILYWITTGIVCLCLIFFVALLNLSKKDKGALGIQIFMTVCLAILPFAVRLIGLIPNVGVTIAGILTFIVVTAYLLIILSVGSYNTIEENQNTWVEPKKEEQQEQKQ